MEKTKKPPRLGEGVGGLDEGETEDAVNYAVVMEAVVRKRVQTEDKTSYRLRGLG
ncbi:hypothetical protein K0M31_011504 [Melipona bicolor]|uniref:Uncharacterized protein n=1 Tax=Melipona bicolor TaxID=60889 RepID=A0AA40G9P1_9HYME|nr:hypothetical protein K0M31_011504 [Melipona bicolor]